MLSVHIGHSRLPDSGEAAVDAIGQCKESLGAAPGSACLLFLSSDHDPTPIVTAIRNAFDGIELVGCTTSGEISSTEGFCEGSVVLTVFSTDSVEIKAGIGRNVSQNRSRLPPTRCEWHRKAAYAPPACA